MTFWALLLYAIHRTTTALWFVNIWNFSLAQCIPVSVFHRVQLFYIILYIHTTSTYNKTKMKVAIFALAALALVHFTGADQIKCLQCPNVLQTCYAKDASSVTCSAKSSCARQVKKGEDQLKAIRKCVIPDAKNPTACSDPAQYDCTVCSTDLCNSSNSLKTGYLSFVSLLLASVFFLIQ